MDLSNFFFTFLTYLPLILFTGAFYCSKELAPFNLLLSLIWLLAIFLTGSIEFFKLIPAEYMACIAITISLWRSRWVLLAWKFHVTVTKYPSIFMEWNNYTEWYTVFKFEGRKPDISWIKLYETRNLYYWHIGSFSSEEKSKKEFLEYIKNHKNSKSTS